VRVRGEVSQSRGDGVLLRRVPSHFTAECEVRRESLRKGWWDALLGCVGVGWDTEGMSEGVGGV
jgi:hypothetical protein